MKIISLVRAVLRSSLAHFTRMLPLRSGLNKISNSRLSKWLCKGEGKTGIHLRNGMIIQCDIQDYNGRMLYFWGTADPKVLTVCRRNLRKGYYFFDIGANHGAIGLQCLDQVGPSGKVLFYEPNPTLCSYIINCADRYHLTNVEVHCCGLWDSAGFLNLELKPGHSGAAFLTSTHATHTNKVEVREVISEINHRADSHQFGVKLDVEGAEHKLLPAITRHPGFRFAVVECNNPQTRACILELMGTNLFYLFGIPKSVFTVVTTPIVNAEQLEQYHDILISKRDDLT
jgi:FkbM family methyltransferase